MVSHSVRLIGFLKNACRAEFNTNLAAFAAFRNDKNLATWDLNPCEIERSASEDFHGDQPSLINGLITPP
jgi:hypothetical protein